MKKPAFRNFKPKIAGIILFWFISASVFANIPFVPFPEGARVKVVGEEIVINGLPLVAYEFHVPRPMSELLNFYKQTWEKDKGNSDTNEPYLETKMAEWVVLSRLERGHNITIQAVEDGIKGVRVLVGISPLPKYLEKGRKSIREYHVPALGLAKIVSFVKSDDNGEYYETYWVDSRDSVEAVLDKYKIYYRSRGYQIKTKRIGEEESDKVTSGFLYVKKEHEEIRLNPMDIGGKTRMVVIRRAER